MVIEILYPDICNLYGDRGNILFLKENLSKYIGKVEFDYCKSFLEFGMKTLVDTFYLPNFETNKMYKGMEQGKHYTLKELGLFESENK